MSRRVEAMRRTNTDLNWRGGRRKYDLVREVSISFLVVVVLVLALSVLFGSPDPPSLSFRQWALDAPQDFVATTVTEVNGTSTSATYGPPYQSTAQNGSLQGFGPLSPERWLGERIPVNTFQDFVARPLSMQPRSALVRRALQRWTDASATDQANWAKRYSAAVAKAKFSGGRYDVAPGDYGPLGTIVRAQYALARSGGLDPAIQAADQPYANGQPKVWYHDDQTFALLYMGDSGQGGGASGCINPSAKVPVPNTCWYYNIAVANTAPQHAGYLAGNTWGIINEVGNWPGAWWLFPYSFWYQWGPGLTSQSADLWAMLMTALVALPLLFLPWIPGLRDIPRLTRVHRVMWGDYYRLVEKRRNRQSR